MEWYGLLIIPLGIIVVVIIRTINFKPKGMPEMRKSHEIDEKRVVKSLSKMLKFKTVSNIDSSLIDQEEFKNFREFLKSHYPLINEKAEYSEHQAGVLFHIKGLSDEFPTVFMSHYDVVPAPGKWEHDPFSGKITEQAVYGRGALDTKSSLNAIMESVEFALSKGKEFKNDLYLAFSGDEEIYGESAPAIVNHLKSKGVTPYMVLDEGGAIVSNMFPGVKKKVAVIGIAEKGFMNVKLTAVSSGGHASTPPKDTPITMLSKAVLKLNNHRSFRLKFTDPVRALFDTIAPYSTSFPIKLIFANIWLFSPVVKLIAKLSGGEFLSMFKTTQAFTLATGSEAINVLPSTASIGINYRLRPGETSDSIVKKITKIIHNPDILVEVPFKSEATSTSLTDDAFKRVTKAIKQTWSDVIPSPYLMVATSDSRHYHEICERVYKFSPMDVSKKDLAKIHGFNEDISIENIINGTNFYLNLIDQL